MARGPKDQVDLDAPALRMELARARARLEEQRDLLYEAHRHAVATTRFTAALSRLSQSNTLEKSGLTAALVELVQAAAESLEVARVGIWLAEDGFERIECVVLVHQGVVSRRPGTVIDRSTCPDYFARAAEARILAIADVGQHPATKGLRVGYLEPLGITSLLDAPVRVFGKVVGIVCHEHIGLPRHWSEVEQAFAANLGDFVALALETMRRAESMRDKIDAEARYRHMVESLPVTLYRIEPQRGIAYVSPRVEALTGRPPSEWRGVDGLRAWLDRVHPDDRDKVHDRLRRTSIIDDAGIEYRISTEGGGARERWVHDVAHELRGADGTVLAVEGVLSDVTERAQADAEVREWERRFRMLFAHGELPFVVADGAGRISEANGAFLEFVGKAAGEVVGLRVSDVFPESRRADLATLVDDILLGAARDPRTVEIAIPEVDELPAELTLQSSRRGPPRTVRFTVIGLDGRSDGRRSGLMAMGMDVTALIERESANHHRTKDASIARLASGVAHDLQNLLSAIQLTAGMLTRTSDAANRAEAIENLSSCASEAAALTQRLMDVARARPTQPRTLVVDAEVENALPILRSLLAGSTVTLEAHLDATDAAVRIGATELRQILMNLVANAGEAAPPGTAVVLRTSKVVFPEPQHSSEPLGAGEHVALEVEDHGPGIAEPLRERIFDPYFTTKIRDAPRSGTGGLGLSTARGLARQARGDVRAEEGALGGARLVLLLPTVSDAQRTSSQ